MGVTHGRHHSPLNIAQINTMEAREYEQMFEEVSSQGDPRLLFANFTSSLLIVNSTLLTYAALGLLGLAGLAYLFYFLTTQQSSSGGYGSSSGSYGSQYSNDDYGRFRRDAEDSDWIRILTMLGLSAELYNDLTQENISNNCPSKLICQAFESRDFLGHEDSYIRKIYQLFTSLQFQTGGGINDNKLTEENSTCSSKYLECEMSLISSLQKLQGERNNF